MTLTNLTLPRGLMYGSASLAVIAVAAVFTFDGAEGPRVADFAPIPTVPETAPKAEEAEAPADLRSGGLADVESSVDRGAATSEAERVDVGTSVLASPSSPAPAEARRAVRQQSVPSLASEADAVAPLGLTRSKIAVEPMPAPPHEVQGRDRFERPDDNPVRVTAEDPVSTFSIDVDTASYAFTRKALQNGVLPQPDAVRLEELVNYFAYDYAPPTTRETPFATHVAVMETPWNTGTRLVRIGLKGYELPVAERPRANLVFLIDTSGSMHAPDKLPLLVNSFRLLLETLGPEDRVSIVAYAGSAGTVLEPTAASEKVKILAALDRLQAGGSTAGGEGIRQAYALAESSFDKDGVNRVILATDGDFNVGIQSAQELKGFVERKRESGVLLSVLGFGRGNYNDALMQTLAQNGNGTAAYIDTLSEARKVMVEEATGTLFPIAKDVKIQVEFNPATVAEYRLIGYETRTLAREDFNNDKVDAGEIGSGHRVTALYEITPAGSPARLTDDLRYGATAADEGAETSEAALIAAREAEYGFLRLRYKAPDGDTSKLIERPITTADEDVAGGDLREARFASTVAAFGQLLRGGRYTGDYGYEDVIALANEAKGPDPFGYRAEFVQLVRLAETAAALERQR